MTENDLPPDPVQDSRVRQARVLARKINLLLDIIMDESGQPYDYPTLSAKAEQLTGYNISRTRWSLLKNGKIQVVPDDALRAIAAVFDIGAEYLLQEDGKIPDRVVAELELVRSMRRAGVLNFAARTLGPVDPGAFRAIAKILDEGV